MKFVAHNFYFLFMVLSESPTKNGGYSRPLKDINLKTSCGIYLNEGLDGVSVKPTQLINSYPKIQKPQIFVRV